VYRLLPHLPEGASVQKDAGEIMIPVSFGSEIRSTIAAGLDAIF